MIKVRRLMTIIEFLPFLNPRELAFFCQLDKACSELILNHTNFQVLFEVWGTKLTEADLKETKISAHNALKVGRKYMMLNQITQSKMILEKDPIERKKGIISVPNLTTLGEKTLEELRKLTFKEVQWNYGKKLGFILSDDQKCILGTNKLDKTHKFNQEKKITKVEVIMSKDEVNIIRTNFYSGRERLVAVGPYSDHGVAAFGGRVEKFEIAKDERLIGCQLQYNISEPQKNQNNEN